MVPRITVSILILAGILYGERSFAASRALIVTGLSGSAENAEELRRLAMETKRLLAERGVPAEGIDVMDGKVTREEVLAAMQKAKSATADDEFWLVLYGYAGKSRGGAPAFQISGPRLTADDMKMALDAIPARQFVLIGTNESEAFLPVLQNARRAIVSATKDDDESGQPRFPEEWVSALTENPRASFAWIAARASALVDRDYANSSLAQAEHARLADPVTGKILEPPFGVNLAAPPENDSAAPGEQAALPGASDIKVPVQDPNAEWERQPGTEETKKLITEARATPNPEGNAALVLEQRIQFDVEEDRTTDRVTFYRVYLSREEAVEDWANYFLPQSPPEVTTKLEVARVIEPDGSSIIFNPAKLPGATNPDENGDTPDAEVYLPEAHAGCLIEVGYRTRALLDATLPQVSEEIPLQRNAPILKTSLEVRVPAAQSYRLKLNNFPATPRESVVNERRVTHWDLGELPPAEALPADPPEPQWKISLGISSLPSWDDFETWYRRLAKDSDAIDDSIRKTSQELTEGAKSRKEKIQRAFEFVSSLRYIAIEIGVQGFRPRTPAQVLANRYGDCKDKANLLTALLRCEGIDARFVLLNRGSATDVSFPSWQFNHAICFVPKAPREGQPEDLWLDSTDSVTPFGFVPPGDFGRKALVFGKESAEFKTVVTGEGSTSELRDTWELKEDGKGEWAGTFRRQAQGLAEDGLRRGFRGLTPDQRRLEVFEIAAALWPEGDFAQAAVSDASDMNTPMELEARTTAASGGLPRPNFPWIDVFSAPSRDRAACLNDGQPFSAVQTVQLRFVSDAPSELPPAFTREIAGQTLEVTWRKIDARTIERDARVELKKPIVAAADYVSLREGLREWSAAVNARLD